jgi:hypothetical protein
MEQLKEPIDPYKVCMACEYHSIGSDVIAVKFDEICNDILVHVHGCTLLVCVHPIIGDSMNGITKG